MAKSNDLYNSMSELWESFKENHGKFAASGNKAAGTRARKSVGDIKEAGEKQGHSWSSLRRAKDELGIRSRKEGMSDGWIWALPSPDPEDAQDAQPGEVSTFGKDEHLRAQNETGRADG